MRQDRSSLCKNVDGGVHTRRVIDMMTLANYNAGYLTLEEFLVEQTLFILSKVTQKFNQSIIFVFVAKLWAKI